VAWQDGRTVAAGTCCAGGESSDPGGSVQGRVFPAKTGESRHNAQNYRLPRRSSAARSVLAISMTTVIGPTPPGTGVIQPATSLTGP